MLEFKNASVAVGGSTYSHPLSVVVTPGEVVCICGSPSHTTPLLLAVLGLEPLASGYITVEGEPVVPGSAPYFRQQMAYVPCHMPRGRQTVWEICQEVLALKSHADAPQDRKTIAAITARCATLGLEGTLLDKAADDVTAQEMQLAMLAMASLLKRPMVLIDQCPQTEAVERLIHQMADEGAEVLMSCPQAQIRCDKIVQTERTEDKPPLG